MDVKEIFLGIQKLRKGWSSNTLEQNWADYLSLIVPLCLAREGFLVERGLESGDWTQLNTSNNTQTNFELSTTELTNEIVNSDLLTSIYSRAIANQFAVHIPAPEEIDSSIIVAISIKMPSPCLLVLLLNKDVQPRLSEVLVRAQLIADIPESAAQSIDNEQVPRDSLLNLLDVLVEVYEAKRFTTAAYALVNGLVAKEQSVDQAAFAWREDAYMKLKAFSHLDRVESKTETMKFFEAALEESADQHQSVWVGQTNESSKDLVLIERANQQLTTHIGADSIFSFCLENKQGESIIALTLVSYKHQFDTSSLHAIHFVTSLLLPRLSELYEQQKGFFSRTKSLLFKGLSGLFGKEYIWFKLLGLIISIFLIWGLLGKLSHRIEGVAQLTTDFTQLVSAPYDGYLKDVYLTSGDRIKQDELLAKMDISEVLLQLSELEADLQRYQSEADKARASFSVIDTKIALARKAQVEAKLERIKFYLKQSEISAPFSGVIVEGERKDLMGAPVKKGQVLFRLARIEGIYLTIEVAQEDVHFIKVNDSGEFAFISQPDQPIGFTITNILPMAHFKPQKGALFEVKAKLELSAQDWWRPGMTGVAKIDVGEKMALWVLGHKTYNRMQLLFWW